MWLILKYKNGYYLQTPQLLPLLEQCLQYLQFLHALHDALPVHIASASVWQFWAIKASSWLCWHEKITRARNNGIRSFMRCFYSNLISFLL